MVQAAEICSPANSLYQHLSGLDPTFLGGPNYLEGQDTGVTSIYNAATSIEVSTLHPTVLEGDIPAQLNRDSVNALTYYGIPAADAPLVDVSSVIELQRHAPCG